MRGYRIYERDGAGRVSVPPIVIEADSDEEAMRSLPAPRGGWHELWHESRLVASSKARPRSRPTLHMSLARRG